MSDNLQGTGTAPSGEAVPRNIAFPHRVDGLRGDVQWASTSVARLRAATFLDGREAFWSATQGRCWPTARPRTSRHQE